MQILQDKSEKLIKWAKKLKKSKNKTFGSEMDKETPRKIKAYQEKC